MDLRNQWERNKLLDENDAVISEHKYMLLNIDYFLRSQKARNKVLYGMDTYTVEQDRIFYQHGSGNVLAEDSRVIIAFTCLDDVVLLPTEFFYYLRIAYKRFMSRNNPQAEKNEFTAGMQHFRNACKIECDENGDPILEGYPHA